MTNCLTRPSKRKRGTCACSAYPARACSPAQLTLHVHVFLPSSPCTHKCAGPALCTACQASACALVLHVVLCITWEVLFSAGEREPRILDVIFFKTLEAPYPAGEKGEPDEEGN